LRRATEPVACWIADRPAAYVVDRGAITLREAIPARLNDEIIIRSAHRPARQQLAIVCWQTLKRYAG
jgi:hypothetical protein